MLMGKLCRDISCDEIRHKASTGGEIRPATCMEKASYLLDEAMVIEQSGKEERYEENEGKQSVKGRLGPMWFAIRVDWLELPWDGVLCPDSGSSLAPRWSTQVSPKYSVVTRDIT
jgi:hypothetical protein